MLINPQNLAHLFKGYKATFQGAFDAAQSDYARISTTVPSSTSAEVYPWLGQTTRFREWIGDRYLQNLLSHDFTIKNRKWENSVSVPKDTIEDDTYGLYTPVIAQLGQDARQHPDELVFTLLQSGFNSLCYDGQYFFDTDHPVLQADGSFASVSNFGGGSGTAWYLIDASKVVKPIIYQTRSPYNFVSKTAETDDNVFNRSEYIYGVDARSNVGFGLWQMAYASKQALDATSYAAARTAMGSLKGENGKPLAVRPTLLVVPPSLEGAARQLLNAEIIGSTTNIYRGTADVLVTPAYLRDAHAQAASFPLIL
jgi:phage major head subunit gpT-like protein